MYFTYATLEQKLYEGRDFFFFCQYLSLLHFQCLEQYLAHRRGSIIFADWMISKWMNIKAKKKYKEKNMILCRFSHWNILNETRVISVFWLLTHFEAWAWLMFQLHNLTRIFKLYQNLQRSKNKNTKEKKNLRWMWTMRTFLKFVKKYLGNETCEWKYGQWLHHWMNSHWLHRSNRMSLTSVVKKNGVLL